MSKALDQLEGVQFVDNTNAEAADAKAEVTEIIVDLEKQLRTFANKLIANDFGQECPYCRKREWGEDQHDADCVFAIAYNIQKGGL